MIVVNDWFSFDLFRDYDLVFYYYDLCFVSREDRTNFTSDVFFCTIILMIVFCTNLLIFVNFASLSICRLLFSSFFLFKKALSIGHP